MSELRERYFGSEAEQVEDDETARDEIRAEWKRQAEFASSEFVQRDLRAWLETKIDLHEARGPAPHEELLFNSGVREGLRMIQTFIRDIERRMENLINA